MLTDQTYGVMHDRPVAENDEIRNSDDDAKTSHRRPFPRPGGITQPMRASSFDWEPLTGDFAFFGDLTLDLSRARGGCRPFP